jgi:peptidoglycan/LPS O-acetylase OafA/YrhL
MGLLNGRNMFYFKVFAYRPFLHTWSLGVEMQFYALAPFLMLLMLSIGRHQRVWRFLCCGILLIASVSAQQFIGARWDRPVAFGLVFCRIWQFAAGIFVFFLVDAEEKIEQQQERGKKGGGGGANIHWPFVLAHQPTTAITATKTAATATGSFSK